MEPLHRQVVGSAQMAALNNVAEVRTREGLSRARLAKLADLDEKTLKRVEEGTRNVAPISKHKIVKALNLLLDKQHNYTFEDLFPNG